MRIRKQVSPFHYLFPAQKAVTGELQCPINLSPWDAIEKPHCTNSKKESEYTNDFFEAEEKEETEAKAKDEEKKDEKMEARRVKVLEIMKCKKTDGKGWHCKRDALLPHTLCGYHLAQLRSYRGRRGKQSAEAVEAGVVEASNYYCYSSILGPCLGKRRATVDEDHKTDSIAFADNHEEEEEDDDDEEEEGSCSCGDKKKRAGRKRMKARSLKSLL